MQKVLAMPTKNRNEENLAKTGYNSESKNSLIGYFFENIERIYENKEELLKLKENNPLIMLTINYSILDEQVFIGEECVVGSPKAEGVEIAVVGRASQVKAGSVVAAGANIEKEEA